MEKIYFSPSSMGFYSEEIHGSNIPSDVVEITLERHAELLAGQANGLIISADSDGLPILVLPAPPSAADLTKAKIAELEASVTNRRIREAVLGIDNGWLTAVNDQITELRKKL